VGTAALGCPGEQSSPVSLEIFPDLEPIATNASLHARS
jgi:hypothetical protein